MTRRATTLLTATTLFAAWLAMGPVASARGAVITQWTFNTNASDGVPNTGTTIPETGTGTIAAIGGVGFSFTQGSGNDTSPTATDGNNNSGFDSAGYPPFDSGNKTAGIELAVSTAGFQDIVLSFDHAHAAGASARFRMQYSTDGVSFTDGDSYVASIANGFTPRMQDFGAVAALDNNPNVRFRIVAEFEGQVYQGTGQNYFPGAHNRFDLVTVSGTPVPEPGTAATAALGLCRLVIRRRRRR